ncbi:hypothetical protein QRX25_14765 [Bacillus sp. L381]|uniref:hypothetical protein n=1 Tax=Bacillus TaxID=1386 RepID=UPI001BA61D0A|nr:MULTISPECIES: hypothetical protein [Bacillus]MCR9040835.1 hypothetical protein [Bacillus velezensis]QUN08745.1 hypothetical protein KEF49_14565 [Bacillus amyloliquefaciens]QYM81817.1 hypothetical protein KTJ85_14410 [Bacillus sp. 7D3]QZY10963.1 hypothetical protein K7B13_14665 [Bacillus amyloliquefaciens]WIX20863.1 hypothetical protein QRX25_14765 [Bacillus sp. L381]
MDKPILHETITEMYTRTKAGKMTRQQRIETITALSDAYFDSTGEHPEASALERMANLVLYEELSDSHPDKVTREEYPIMSETQFDERFKREASDKLAEEYDQTGSYKGRPIRRPRSSYENKLLDRRAKARNEERRKNYNSFTKGYLVAIGKTPKGEVITERRYTPGQFTVNIATGEKVYH